MAGAPTARPLSALLSQVLTAFTVEFDNAFEHQMVNAGHPSMRLSLFVWANLMRFVADGGVSVRALAAASLTPESRLKTHLGCLERWGVITMSTAPDARPQTERDGWGSARGIRGDWIVRATAAGLQARKVWTPLAAEIEERWVARFGKAKIDRLRKSLESVVAQFEIELPHALPDAWDMGPARAYPPRRKASDARMPLPALLSKALHAFALEFDAAAPAPLSLSANTIRVLGETPVRMSDLPQLTGGSPESTSMVWQMKPYVLAERDPSGRGQVARLTPLGLAAQRAYVPLTKKIEQRWAETFGADAVTRLRDALSALFVAALAEGLIPPANVARAGHAGPALGRQAVAAAAKQRMRDLVQQTEAFIRDPAQALPHYPRWDANRGFGP